MKQDSTQKPQHIHITGICGVGTGALAIALHKAGFKVTGSDKGFYPPVSTNLTDAGVIYYAGWHPEKFDQTIEMGGVGEPDSIIVGGSGTSLSNPEALYAKEHNIPVMSFAQAIGKYIVQKKSIVTVGTWGKTTSSSLLSFILLRAGMDPSYFTGGLSLSHPTGALTTTNSPWSVVEGDEYQAAIWDRQAKFNYYSPTHLLLTSVSWDHADLYPTEDDYFHTFEKLIKQIPENAEAGVIIACTDNEGVQKVLASTQRKAITYGQSTNADYYFHSITHTKAGIAFDIAYADIAANSKKTVHITSPMLGRFNAENIAGAFAMAHHIGIPSQTIVEAIAEFQGIRRRLERRLDGTDRTASPSGITVLDVHAPTAEKASSVLESIREVYEGALIAVYEPNIGGRQKSSIATYDGADNTGAFAQADTVFLPHFTKLKVDSTKTNTNELPLEAPELAAYISKKHAHVTYIENDETLIAQAILAAKKGGENSVIAFLGSHGFRGMIEATITSLRQQSQ
ncbi:MAG: hypothetical protein RIT04_690 [Candidatus Parcubacteria bacterium]|jgi:UDP-N-acetylmuramate: L-alanyl-gamma-D-glutamyl-meso-diaminopimelate ligase